MPDLLEHDSPALKADPNECLTRNVIKMDEMLLGGELGRTAMTCGTTSTVVYMRDEDCYVRVRARCPARGARVGHCRAVAHASLPPPPP